MFGYIKHKFGNVFRCWISVCLVLLVLCHLSGTVSAQSLDSAQISGLQNKSSILFVLIWSSKWPNQLPLEKRKIGVLTQNDELFAQFDKSNRKDSSFADTTHHGATFSIHKKAATDSVRQDTAQVLFVRFRNIEEVKDVQILYSDLKEGYNPEDILKQISGKAILLVTDNNPDFENSMINFLNIRQQQFFSINRDRIKKEKIKINFIVRKILSKDGAAITKNSKEYKDVYSKYKNAVQTTNKKIEVNKDELLQMLKTHEAQSKDIEAKLKEIENTKAEVQQQKAQIQKQKDEIKGQETKILKQKSEIEAQLRSIDVQDEKMKAQQAKLLILLKESDVQLKNIRLKEEKLNLMSIESDRKEKEILSKEAILKKNQDKIVQQNKEISEQASILKTQKSVLMVSIFIILVISVLAFFTYKNYRQKQLANAQLAKQNDEIRTAHAEIALQKQKTEEANEELQQQNEEIASQRDEIENQKHLIEEQQKEVIDSITYAKRLQQAILPPISFIKQYLPESFVLYQPKDIVAGDFYWMHTNQPDNGIVGNQQILIAAADCTGHGVPGAMVSIVCSNALNRAVKEYKLTDPGEILDKVTELVVETFEKSGEEIKDGMDISLAMIEKINSEGTSKTMLKWAGANNPLWVVNKENQLISIKADKQPIGHSDYRKPFTTHMITLEKNNAVYLITDGYADQFGGPKGKKFKYKQLEEILIANSSLPMSRQSEVLNNSFQDWKGNLEQIDDVTIIGIKI